MKSSGRTRNCCARSTTCSARQEELVRLNRELEDTNRGVVALYAELDERADHLRRADEIKTRFLSNMTHEFRTPVNSILALHEPARRAARGAVPTSKDELFFIRKSAQQLSDLVDDLLDLAKVEAGKIDVRPATFEIGALFGALRGMLRPLLVNQSLALVFDEPEGIPPIYSDESKLSQILRNFISNALKYTERGEVRVSAQLHAGRDEVEFTVADTGIGIPEKDISRIFDEFVQIENPLQRRVKGTGLGLPLSKRLAELLGGRIAVDSTLGIGSTFSLTVPLVYRDPLQVDAGADRDRSAPRAGAGGRGQRRGSAARQPGAGVARATRWCTRGPPAPPRRSSRRCRSRPSCSTSGCTAPRPGICWRGSSETPDRRAVR